MQRLRLLDVRRSFLPEAVGYCAADANRLITTINEAQERCVLAGGETGWWGSWAKMVFNVSCTDPYLTTPRGVARLINMDVCKRPIPIQNEFYEFLEFSTGLQAPCVPITSDTCVSRCQQPQTYERGTVATFSDIIPPDKIIRVYLTDAADVGKRVLLQGEDQNEATILTMDGLVQVQGVFVSLVSPFADSPMEISKLTGVQKDITIGSVSFYEVDQTTGDQRLILTMEPGEEVANYRRYYLAALPRNCCDGATTVQVTAMAKLELIPVKVDTDYLLIQCLPALIEMAGSVRYGRMDESSNQQLAKIKLLNAIKLLNGQLVHYEGKEKPAIGFFPFGSARLSRAGVGSLF